MKIPEVIQWCYTGDSFYSTSYYHMHNGEERGSGVKKVRKFSVKPELVFRNAKAEVMGPAFVDSQKSLHISEKSDQHCTQNKIKISFHVLLFIETIYNIIKVYISKAQDDISITKVNSVCFCVAIGFICPNI